MPEIFLDGMIENNPGKKSNDRSPLIHDAGLAMRENLLAYPGREAYNEYINQPGKGPPYIND
jgi:hypothetical protein